ncbi:hypothetical protein AM571_PC01636 (plasmid) [Rhizobium etli 8C-3]|uniref:DUF883 domain-containing protein n=1 Tax=Rhizobium etli 8C-3 TaxID=538025 RepID=A0A1L5PGJ7_RHIET|nr:hypothetical protein [Rhizobium etli]APO79367.1 hypothetical protein AM571_PC01636 [Rhizobium etli 8C-3]
MAKELEAGFTGSPVEKPEGMRKVASDTASAIKREANAVAIGVSDHPQAAGSLVLGIGAAAFGLGYLLGRSSVSTRSRYWR